MRHVLRKIAYVSTTSRLITACCWGLSAGSWQSTRANYRKAVLLFEYVLSIYDKAFGTNHIFSAPILYELGFCHLAQGRNEEAISYFEHALYIFLRQGIKDVDCVVCAQRLGEENMRQGKHSEANTLTTKVGSWIFA